MSVEMLFGVKELDFGVRIFEFYTVVSHPKTIQLDLETSEVVSASTEISILN